MAWVSIISVFRFIADNNLVQSVCSSLILAAEIMLSLQPIFASIRKHGGLTCGIGFLHPITDRVTISAHGCASHSWSRKVSGGGGGSLGANGSEDFTLRKMSVPVYASTSMSPTSSSSTLPLPTPDRKISAPSRMMMTTPPGYSTLPRVGRAVGSSRGV